MQSPLRDVGSELAKLRVRCAQVRPTHELWDVGQGRISVQSGVRWERPADDSDRALNLSAARAYDAEDFGICPARTNVI